MKRVLVVDDDDEIRQIISAALKMQGYDAIDVSNGDEAVRQMSMQSFDLVVCDLFMPDKDGMETMLAIRKTQPLIPIILITGGGRLFWAGGGGLEDLLESAELLGVTLCMMKPFRPSQLISFVKRALSTMSGDAGSLTPGA